MTSNDPLRAFRHDVRSPLNVVLGFAAVLEGELTGEQADSARMIREAAEQILSLVEGIDATREPDDEPHQPGDEPVLPGPATGIRVVLVEDHPSNVRLVERILRHRPHVELITFATGEEAVDGVPALRPQAALVLLDRHLPGIDGFEVLAHLRESVPLVPVVMVTADATPAVRDEAESLGATGMLTKPFAVGDVLAQVDRYASAPRSLSR